MSYSLPEFLAHAIALECEAEERYLELADMMEVHNNRDTAKVFREMAQFSRLHAEAVAERSKNLEIPKLKSWEYRWETPPEVGGDDGLHYLMKPYHALNYARENEIRGMNYYRTAAAESQDEEVRRLGGEFADEEKEHVAALDRWLATTAKPSADWMEDPDPIQSQ
jgi:rubrerythrin